MRELPFVKVAGCGNDFILLDRRKVPAPVDFQALARKWCSRQKGIGADGVLLLLPSRRGDARMRIFNPDGSEAEMCGNGLRCVAWYLHEMNGKAASFTVETKAGLLRSEVVGEERVRVTLTPPKALRLGLQVAWKGGRLALHAVQSGVPHAVLLTTRLKEAEVERLGPFLRFHKLFRPQGTNVNFVQIRSPHRIEIRTYERGVEKETLACGTGAVASVVIGNSLGRLKPPVAVLTASGELLRVDFQERKRPWEDLTLEGPARVIFEGKVRP
ncbi:MAG: diaminopimelate epimerase [Candidatus Omnitrophica bacterium]|nr:diaminopimelate epimerase [Candidatus Omnitrophota bacterium]